jgi:acetylglutamate kinase
VGISGVDAAMIRAHKRSPVRLDNGETVDYGFVGDIDAVDTNVLTKLLDNGLMPVVSPLSADENGNAAENINADTVAAAIGAALSAEKLMLCTGAPGILERVDDPTSIISYTDLAASSACAKKRKSSTACCRRPGPSRMRSAAACDACTSCLTSRPKASSPSSSPTRGAGTLIVADVNALTQAEQQSGK